MFQRRRHCFQIKKAACLSLRSHLLEEDPAHARVLRPLPGEEEDERVVRPGLADPILCELLGGAEAQAVREGRPSEEQGVRGAGERQIAGGQALQERGPQLLEAALRPRAQDQHRRRRRRSGGCCVERFFSGIFVAVFDRRRGNRLLLEDDVDVGAADPKRRDRTDAAT